MLNARAAEPAPLPGRGPVEPDAADDFPFRLGAKLRHARYGEGLLVGLEREGDEVIATVRFASVGRKRLSLQYAHLEEPDGVLVWRTSPTGHDRWASDMRSIAVSTSTSLERRATSGLPYDGLDMLRGERGATADARWP